MLYSAMLRSVCILITVSSLLGWVFIDSGFWRVFAISTTLQIILGYIIKRISNINLQYKQRLIEIQQASVFENNGVEVTCAYCEAINFIPIQYKTSNDFTCQDCKNGNSVYVNITTAQITDPLMVDPLVVNSYNNTMSVVQGKSDE